MVFCDLANSTVLAERLGREATRTLLDRFFEPALAEARQYEGTINQFLGWLHGAVQGPAADEDHARRAVWPPSAIGEGATGCGSAAARRRPRGPHGLGSCGEVGGQGWDHLPDLRAGRGVGPREPWSLPAWRSGRMQHIRSRGRWRPDEVSAVRVRERPQKSERSQNAQSHLTTALAMLRDMDMRFWLVQAQPTLKGE